MGSLIPAARSLPEWLLLSKSFDPGRAVPDITVYIPAYNVAQFLPRAIESLLTQTLSPAEILVIDDDSTDDSANVAQRYPRVTVVRHERNCGLAAARNTAFRTARGEFVASLDADCVAEPTWLERGRRPILAGRGATCDCRPLAAGAHATGMGRDAGTQS